MYIYLQFLTAINSSRLSKFVRYRIAMAVKATLGLHAFCEFSFARTSNDIIGPV